MAEKLPEKLAFESDYAEIIPSEDTGDFKTNLIRGDFYDSFIVSNKFWTFISLDHVLEQSSLFLIFVFFSVTHNHLLEKMLQLLSECMRVSSISFVMLFSPSLRLSLGLLMLQ